MVRHYSEFGKSLLSDTLKDLGWRRRREGRGGIKVSVVKATTITGLVLSSYLVNSLQPHSL
jgi:hypothetical protein